LHSELRIFIQDGLDYRSLMKGAQLFKKYGGEETFDNWVLQNLPALKDEPFCANYYDFAEKVQFQLAGYYTKSSDIHGTREYVKLMNTWPKLVKDILSTNNYQGYLGKKGLAKKTLKNILNGAESEKEALDKIYQYLTNEFDWDGEYHLFRDQKLSDLLKVKKGNSAELNLFFVSLLKNAGLKAHPAIISTKGHGFVSKVYPLRSQFNHVVAAVKLNDKYELVDVVDPSHPMSLLPVNDLNYDALLLESKPDTAYWLKIPKPKKSKKVLIVDIDYSQEDLITGKAQLSANRYESVLQRTAYHKANDDNRFIREEMLEDERFEIEKVIAEHTNNVDQTFKLECTFQASKEDLENGDFIYIDPYLSKIDEHPFKAKERNTPIDFYYPQTNLYLCNVIIPPGYEIEELPESKNLALPNREVILKSSSKVLGNKIQILLDLSITTPLISKDEYGAIQEIFDHYFSKQDQQIVLKKKVE
ncbi:MAG: transglutaminase-like domain-containing protein, partial [Bacteroidota bacterium]